MRKATILSLAVLASAGIAASGSIALAENQGDAKNQTSSKKKDVTIEKIGEPINCIQLTRIRSSDVIDNRTIDFKMRGSKIYRNTLPRKCSRLGFEEAFSYRTSLNKLCNVDIIRVLDRTGPGIRETTACGLGKFQEIKKVKAKKEPA